jgi:hypothetical protein
MTAIKRLGSAVGLLFFVASISFATPIVTPVPPPVEITAQSALMPETFKLTYDAPNPPGYIQFQSGGTNSISVNWNFFALLGWTTVQAIDSVEFDLTLALANTSFPNATFTMELEDTLSTIFGPKTLVNMGVPGPNNTYNFSVILDNSTPTGQTVLNAFLADGFVTTLLARDPSFGQGQRTNAFRFYSGDIIVNAQVIPEPATYVLIGSGLLGAALFVRRKRTA